MTHNDYDIIQCKDLRVLSLAILDAKSGIDRESYDLTMLKDEPAVKGWYDRVGDRKFSNVLELGIFMGGSLPFLADICQAEKLIGVDIVKSSPAIAEAIEKSEFKNVIQTQFEKSQTDKAKLSAIIERNFPDGIDLIVDDACHLLDETRTSFEILFPFLKPGGLYVIEDYRWGQFDIFKTMPFFQNKPGMIQIITELSLLTASREELVQKLTVEHNTITLVKGEGKVEDNFTIKDAIHSWAPFDYDMLKNLQAG